VMDFAERFSPWFCDVSFEELTRNQANERFGSTGRGLNKNVPPL